MSSLHAVAVVPARYDSQRFPGKVLADIGGNPLIRWVFERAARARLVDRTFVATDSGRVEAACRAFTDDVWLSRAAHASGTDRVAEIARDLQAEIFVNVQTDEPLMDPALVDALIELVDREGVDFASAVAPIHGMSDFLDPNVVKVVCDATGDALYFSRAPIPWPRGATLALDAEWPVGLRAYKHIGIYAYRREALLALAALPRSEAEEIESLEQLRVLDRGWRMRILEWDYTGIGVDTEQDLDKLRKYITKHSLTVSGV
jgi:3-deoxy-manno-octulosonate cytidylyltransferase (CMP-KDO synthetase)